MELKRIGLDISKNVFYLHGIDQQGEVVLNTSVRRGQLHQTFSRLPRCIVGLEACGTAHQWGQQLASLGHEVRLFTPHVLTPYRERLDGGSSAAQAICEALGHAPFTRIKATRRRVRLGLIPIPARLLERLKFAGS
jgi:transposase